VDKPRKRGRQESHAPFHDQDHISWVRLAERRYRNPGGGLRLRARLRFVEFEGKRALPRDKSPHLS
jgi:hypothetical protein